MESELYYDERDYEIGGAFYDGPTWLVDDDDDFGDSAANGGVTEIDDEI